MGGSEKGMYLVDEIIRAVFTTVCERDSYFTLLFEDRKKIASSNRPYITTNKVFKDAHW
jgi:hypothetical protein